MRSCSPPSWARPDLGVSELAAELGMHNQLRSRLLAVLRARGLVRREGDRFSPGPEPARLGGGRHSLDTFTELKTVVVSLGKEYGLQS